MINRIALLTTFLVLFFTFSIDAQVKNVQNEAEKQGTRRINTKIDKGIDSGFDAIEEGIGSLFGKKKKKKNGQAQKVNTSMETTSQNANEDFGAFSEMFPANGGTVAYPPFLDWEIPNASAYKFTVHLEGDDWSDWLTKTTTNTNVGFSNLPTATTNFKWQVIAEGNGQRLESPWQSFSTTDGTDGGSLVASKPVAPQMNVEWSRFDFVPGDEVIFEDAPSIDEENGEFPSRWDLHKGNSEIVNVNGENVIAFPQGGTIMPYLENAKEDYLPEVFTIEMDAYFRPGYCRRLWVKFWDKKNQDSGDNETIEFYINSAGLYTVDTDGVMPGVKSNSSKNGGWRHFSIAYTKGKLKVYIDDTRLINIPRCVGNPSGITLEMDGYGADKPEDLQYIKNFRIAKGGVKYYDRVLADGKIIVNGIRFDVNKATIKPESNGAINKIFQLMQKQTDLNFSVEGHTDSDGDKFINESLSKKRAEAVMNRLVSMGISSSRLKSTGWGESKPIGENGTAEGKANNRRVEFVKFTGSAAPATAGSSSAKNPAFDKLNRKSIAVELDKLPEQTNIAISNNKGIVNGAGTVILYATSDGNLGKMEILNVDKNDGYKLTTRFVSYNYNGSIHSESNHLEIEGTYTCDLDKGKVGGDVQSEVDFHFGIQDSKTATIYPGETAILRVLKY